MRHSRASTMASEGVIERRRRQKWSLGATIQGSAHRAFAEVRRTSGMCQMRIFDCFEPGQDQLDKMISVGPIAVCRHVGIGNSKGGTH